MNNIAEQICEAVDIIVSQKISKAGYDRTIQGIVTDCLDPIIGKYKIRYQNSNIIAYAANPSIKYNIDSLVYILIPGNDMSEDKVILSSMDKNIFNYMDTEMEDKYQTVTGNLAVLNTNTTNEINKMCSYINPDGQTIYSESDEKKSPLLIYNKQLIDGIKEGGYLKIKMNVETSLPLEQQARGQYGLSFVLLYDNGTTEIVDFSNFKMIGNPYNYTKKQEQTAYFQINNIENLKSIQSISTYSKDFPNEKDEAEDDITISDIEIYAARLLTNEELKEVRLDISSNASALMLDKISGVETPQFFTLTAVLKANGVAATGNIEYHWFKENLLITDTHKDYNSYGGNGWEYLGKSEEANGYYQFPKEDLTATKNVYKCIAKFSGESSLYSATKTITNEITESVVSKKVNIISSEGTVFYNGQGKTVLQVSLEGVEDASNYYYIWKIKNKDGENKIYYPYSNNTDAMVAEWIQNRDIKINSGAIDTVATFECFVYDENEDFFNSASITISNTANLSSSYFNIAIENGNQVFIYNKYNLSPSHESLKFPQQILPINFKFSDNKGIEIPYNKIIAADENGKPYGEVRWLMPINNTLLKKGNYSSTNEGNFLKITNIDSLIFKIADEYNPQYTNNVIYLEIEYQDIITRKEINFTFVKDNDMDSNGTDTLLQEEYKYGDNVLLTYLDNPNFIYVKSKTSNIYCDKSVNWTGGNVDFFNGVKLWKNHIAMNADSVQWKALPSTPEIFKMTADNKFTYLKRQPETSPTSILRATVIKDSQRYLLDVPIITVNMNNSSSFYRIALKPNTGFQKVIYNRNGTNPSYDNTFPFEILVGDSRLETLPYSNFTYKWSVLGDKVGLSIIEDSSLQANQKRISPIDTWDGSVLNTAVLVEVFYGGGKIGDIHIPISMCLDRTDIESIYSWDGNYVESGLGEKILTPIGYESNVNANGFSGVFLGRIQNQTTKESGLFSYDAGTRVLSATSTGTIWIGPRSKSYIEASAQGLEIKYNNNNFALDKDGILQNITLGSEVSIPGENISEYISYTDSNAIGLGKVLYNLHQDIKNSVILVQEDIELLYQEIEDLTAELNAIKENLGN